MSLPRRYALIGMLLIAPTVLIFVAVIAYPLSTPSISRSSRSTRRRCRATGSGSTTTGDAARQASSGSALGTTLIWTVGTLSLQIVFGVAMALLLNLNILFRSLARSLVLFPYFVSTVVAVLVWRWMFNDLYGILNQPLVVSAASSTCRSTGSARCRTP